MGRTRTNQQPKEQEQGVTGRQVATIAALLLTAPKPGDLAAALLGLLPAALLAKFPKIGAQAAMSAATLVLSTVDAPERNVGRLRSRTDTADGALGITPDNGGRDEAVYGALYAINAARRLFRGREDFGAALETEREYLALHRQAKERRVKAQRLVEANADIFGPVLGWYHGNPIEPRIHHEAAHGFNFRAGIPPTRTGGYPSSQLGCTCSPGKPFPNAEVMN